MTIFRSLVRKNATSDAERFLFDLLSVERDFIRDYFNRSADVAARERFQWVGIQDFVLSNGAFWTPQPESSLAAKKIMQGEPENCYGNALTQVVRKRADGTGYITRASLFYVEGYFVQDDLPIPHPHAWLGDLEGNAYEVTAHKPGVAYAGVPISPRYCLEVIQRTGFYGILENNIELMTGARLRLDWFPATFEMFTLSETRDTGDGDSTPVLGSRFNDPRPL